jgi:hypothetical protein
MYILEHGVPCPGDLFCLLHGVVIYWGLGRAEGVKLGAEAVEEDGGCLAQEKDYLSARDAEVVLAHLGDKINLITST